MAHTLFPGATASDLRRAIEERTCCPSGRRWNVREYLGWVARSYVPRTFALPVRTRPALSPETL